MQKSTILNHIGTIHLKHPSGLWVSPSQPNEVRVGEQTILKYNYAIINDSLFTLANNLVFSLYLQAFLYQISSLTQLVQFVACS